MGCPNKGNHVNDGNLGESISKGSMARAIVANGVGDVDSILHK